MEAETLVQDSQTEGSNGEGATLTAIMAYGLLFGAFYCINLLSKGEARRRHKVYLVLCCMLLPKMRVMLARGSMTRGERVTYSGLVRTMVGRGSAMEAEHAPLTSPSLPPFRVPEVTGSPTILNYSNSTLPIPGTEYKVAVLVLSAPKNLEKRQQIRKLRLPGCHLQFLFLIGQTGNSTLEETLQEETDAYDDLLRLSVKESYRTLPRKTLGGFRFVLNKLPHYDLVLKLDDDLEISSDALASALAEHLPWQPSTLYCYQLKNITPLRRPWGQHSKFYVSYSTYPYMAYPDYCLGWIIAATLPTIETLLQEVPSSVPVHVDDVYITGILRQGTNISLTMLSSRSYYHSSLHEQITSQCRFLSWALHIFAFDLAYEPEGWPWKPIKSVVVGFHELLVTVPASPGDLMAQACVYFSLPACLAWLLKPPHGPAAASPSRSQAPLTRG